MARPKRSHRDTERLKIVQYILNAPARDPGVLRLAAEFARIQSGDTVAPAQELDPSTWFTLKEVTQALAFESDDASTEWLERSNVVIVTNDAGQFVHRHELQGAVVLGRPKNPTSPILETASPRFEMFAKDVAMQIHRDKMLRRNT